MLVGWLSEERLTCWLDEFKCTSLNSQPPLCTRTRTAHQDATPISLDVLGTAYDDKSRPPPLSYSHICTYLARTAAGGPPLLPADSISSAARIEATVAAAAAGLESGSSTQQQMQMLQVVGPESWQLLFGGQDPATGLELSTDQIDFGACSRLAAAEPRSVAVTNHTGAKLTVFACVPAWQDPSVPHAGSRGASGARSPSPQQRSNGGASSTAELSESIAAADERVTAHKSLAGSSPLQQQQGQVTGVFQVFPDSLELRPGASGTLKVAFRPPKDGQHYSSAIQVRGGGRGPCLAALGSTCSWKPRQSAPLTTPSQPTLRRLWASSRRSATSASCRMTAWCRLGAALCLHWATPLRGPSIRSSAPRSSSAHPAWRSRRCGRGRVGTRLWRSSTTVTRR